jgi:uncharacterized protein YodC (DUF2158 family)
VAVIDLSSMLRMIPFPSQEQEDFMAFEPGDVVVLKSGGLAMTVAAVDEESVECLWLGDEGELFRESIPTVALIAASDASEDDVEEEEEDDDEEEKEEGEDEETDQEDEEPGDEEAAAGKRKRKTA